MDWKEVRLDLQELQEARSASRDQTWGRNMTENSRILGEAMARQMEETCDLDLGALKAWEVTPEIKGKEA